MEGESKSMRKIISSLLVLFLIISLVLPFSGCTPKENTINVPNTVTTATKPEDSTSDTSEDEVVVEQNKQPDLTEPEEAPEETVLIIYGDGVKEQTNWSLDDLKALTDGYRELIYSTTNNWPTYSFMEGNGVSIRYLLEQAGILDSAKTLVFSASDGYRVNITLEQIYETRFAYEVHSAGNSSNPTEIEPIISWKWGSKGDIYEEEIRPIFGQRGPCDVNTSSSVKSLNRIEVITWDAGVWDKPDASIKSGSTVTKGTELELTHPFFDNTGIYYTIDGSEPSYDSLLYNKSTTYFQPELIVPIIIEEDITIKAFAGALGKGDSEIVTFTYTVG